MVSHLIETGAKELNECVWMVFPFDLKCHVMLMSGNNSQLNTSCFYAIQRQRILVNLDVHILDVSYITHALYLFAADVCV